MTIVMDEEGFSSSITSLSSGSVNFHQQLQTTLIEPSTATIVSNNNNNNMNTSYVSNVSSIVSLNTSSTPNLNMMQTTSISPNTNMTSSSASITTNGTNMSCRSNNNSINSESNGGAGGSHPFVLFLFRPNASSSNPSAAAQQNGNVLVNGSSVMTGSGEVFEERKIYLDKPCKVGRSVAKLRPEPNNAIFDCKVLSRNHALLWEENSKYYIQDTKSSNGTFLNGNRLGKSNEDSEPFEITSGDIIQFGVDVTENQKKVTHGCITVEIRLFNKNGEEVIDKPLKSNKVDVQSQELYQLAMFLQEALFREEALNKKLRTLQAFIEQAKENSENSWLTLIQEDRLMTRIDYLEKQNLSIKMAAAAAAAAANNNNSDSNQTAIVNSLRDEKLKIETAAKETVEKIIVEKNALTQQLDDLRVYYSNLTEEHTQMCKMNEDNRGKILGLADQNQELATKLDESEMSLAELKKKQAETMTALEADKAIADKLVQELNDKIASLNAQIEMSSNEKELLAKQVQLLAEQIELERKTATINGEIDEDHHKTNKSIDENSFHLYNNNNNKNDNHVDEYNKNDFLRNVSVPVKEEKYQRAAATAAAAALNTSNHDSSSSAQRHLSEELNDSLEMSSSSHNNNNKINNNIKSPSTVSNHKEELLLNGPTSPNRTHESLEMALERIDELENELNEKTRLVNELLLSKDDILNAKYKEIVEGVGITNNNYMCKYCKNSNNNNTGGNNNKLDSLAQSLSFMSSNNDHSHSESFNTSVSVDVDNNNDIAIHLEAIQNKIQQFFENLNNKNNESNNQDEESKQTTGDNNNNNNNNENNLRDLCKSIEELRTSLKQLATTTKSEQQKRTTTKISKKKNDKTNLTTSSTTSGGGDDSSYLGAAAASGGVSSSFSSSLSRDNDDDEDDEKSAAAVAISTRQGLSSSTYDVDDDDDADDQSRTEKTTTTFKRVVGAGESAKNNKSRGGGGATTRSGEQDTSVSELEHEIAEKESLIQELRDGYDDLSLRARIVSYFSMIPLIFLLVAVIIAFYPTLSTITATGL